MQMIDPGWKPDVEALRNDPRLPKPTGFKLAVLVPEVQKATAGGILLPDAAKDRERLGSMLGLVLFKGPDAYTDHRRFPSGPWCEPGDWVITPPYPAISLEVDLEGANGQTYRVVFINDDAVSATVGDPRALKRR